MADSHDALREADAQAAGSTPVGMAPTAVEAPLVAALGDLPSPVLLVDDGAVIRYANAEACDFLGYAAAELVGRPVAMVDPFYADDMAPLPPSLTDDQRIGRRIWRRRNGIDVTVECQLSLSARDGRRLMMMLGRDLTAQIVDDTALATGDARFRGVFEDSGIGMVIVTADGALVQVNGAFAQMLGYERGEISGRSLLDFVHPEDSDAAAEVLRSWSPGNRFFNRVELRFRGHDGRPVWTQVTLSGITTAEKDVPVAVAQIQDVTDYQLAVQALRLSQTKFRDFASAASDWMWEMDADLRFSYFSHRLTEMTGVSAMTLLGKGLRDSEIADDVAPDAFHKLLQDIEERRPFRNVVYSRRRTDGTLTRLSISGKPVFDEDGTFRGYRGTGTDITERLQAEDALRRSEEQLRRAVLDAPIPMMIHADDGEVVMISHAWSEISGFTHVEIPTIEAWFAKAYPNAKDHYIAQRRMRAIYTMDRRIETGTRTVTTKSGVQRRWDFRSSPLGKSADGRRYVITMAVDVTERFAAEEKLRILSRAVDQSASAMAITDSGGTIRYVNRKFVDMTGYSEAEAHGTPLGAYQAPGNLRWFARILETLDHQETWQDMVLSRRKSGESYWESISVFGVRDETERVSNFVAIKEDITDQKRTELELHAAMERAEIANRAKSEFLANMSHELRTPLNAIIGFSETMTRTMFGPLGSAKYEEYANDIQQSARHLLGIINDILDLSKIEAGKVMLDEAPLDLAQVIHTSVELIQPRTRETGIELTVDLMPDLPELIGDERAMRQILLNLLSNAAKFTPAGGRVTVSARIDENGGHELAIADTGIGIAEKDLETVLKPFGQADSSLNRKFEGTGLGLSITKSLVETLGGELELKSAPGAGTTVFVRLPAERVCG